MTPTIFILSGNQVYSVRRFASNAASQFNRGTSRSPKHPGTSGSLVSLSSHGGRHRERGGPGTRSPASGPAPSRHGPRPMDLALFGDRGRAGPSGVLRGERFRLGRRRTGAGPRAPLRRPPIYVLLQRREGGRGRKEAG